MGIYSIFVIVVVILLVAIVIIKKTKKNLFANQKSIGVGENQKLAKVANLKIKLEMVPVTNQIDERNLLEIRDNSILTHVNNLVPGILQAGVTADNAIRGTTQVLYQAIIPSGAQLSDSRAMAGAVRGIYHGAGGIKGHANFIVENNMKNVAANAVSSTMGVAAMIVGQYYMEQVNTKLTTMSDVVSGISDFLDNEYKSRVYALLTQVKKMASFQINILNNHELRAIQIMDINSWEQQCMELLGQANLTIVGFSNKSCANFNDYEKKLSEIQNWYIYQKTLLDLLYRIADLKHTLHLGSISKEQCDAVLPIYSTQVKEAISQLRIWHQHQTEKFGINIDANHRKRLGMDKFVHKLPGLITEKYNFRSISQQTADLITTQIMDDEMSYKIEAVDLFKEDVRVIVKEGKLYYLPEHDIGVSTAN